ncbi:MAG TPA: hypothetical protein QGF58_07155 [Myxococcota bacterium]|nr:hypothetical protein [Myxococcota bacterium]
MSIRRVTARELRRHQVVSFLQTALALAPAALAAAFVLDSIDQTAAIPISLAVVALGTACITRIRRPSPSTLLRRIDPSECLLAACALEEQGIHEGLALLVHDRAGSIPVHLEMPWRIPRKGLVAALAILILGAVLQLSGNPIDEAYAGPPPPALDAETREALARQAERIEELQRIPHLSEEAREELERAKEQLGHARASTDAREAQGAMSRAERSLSRLSDQSSRLYEPEALQEAPSEALSAALSEAMERGDSELAKQLVDEAMRRMGEVPKGQDLGELGDALDEAMKQTGSADARELTTRLGKLDKRPSDALVREMLSELREARADSMDTERRLARAGRPGESGDGAEPSEGKDGRMGLAKEGDGEGAGPGQPAPGDSPGMLFASMAFDPGSPGTSPGPGHAEQSGEGDAGVRGASAAKSWITGQWEQGPQVLLGSLEGRARGYDDPETWTEVHRSYSAVAEEVAEREQLPLSRRDYVRDYFHAIAPR